MTRSSRRVAIAVVAIAVVGAALAAWLVDRRARPDRVGPRLVDALQARYHGATVRAVGPALLAVAMPSGTLVDVRSQGLFDRCHESRLSCGRFVDDTVAAVDDVDRAARSPKAGDLRPALVPDASGYRYGFVAEPFFGTIEFRVAVTRGFASTDVTATMADRLHLSGDALRAAALANARGDPAPRLVPIAAASGSSLRRVAADGDPAAVLADPARMAALATALGTRRVACFVPSRGVLYVALADDAATKALDALRTRMPGVDALPLGIGVFTYDVDAPEGSRLAMTGLR